MSDLISKLLKSGVKTSEFWVALAAMLLPYALQIPETSATAWAIAHGGVWAGYGVAAVYIAARAYIKGKQLQAIGPDVIAEELTTRTLDKFPNLTGNAVPHDFLEAAAPEGYAWDRTVSRYVRVGVVE